MSAPTIHHPSCPARDGGAWCVCPPRIDPRVELERVGELAGMATAALADEREGDFRRDVLELHTRAATLLHLVATW